MITFKDIPVGRKLKYGGCLYIRLEYTESYDEDFDASIYYDSVNLTRGGLNCIGEETLVELVDNCKKCRFHSTAERVTDSDNICVMSFCKGVQQFSSINTNTHTCSQFESK